ncbi:GTPase Era [Rickettsiales bacterium]|nr:GTPase Era [Rickettsiales bacterium]
MTENKINNQQKTALIALIGPPNAGKSSLTNKLLGQKISIASHKVQTTRNVIKAVITEGNSQLVLFDTPGIFIPKKDRPLERYIVKNAWQAIRQIENIFLLIDGGQVEKGINNIKNIISDLKKHEITPNVIINKTDLIQSDIKDVTNNILDLGIEKIFFTSAKNGDGINDLKKYLFDLAIAGNWLFPKDDISDISMKFMASEITREKLFLKLKEDLPYAIDVETENWEETDDSVKIHQVIYVLKDSQKKIIIGKNGSFLKKIGSSSRAEISDILGKKTHLFLFVKVKQDWMINLFR